jgi:hypothetical protein
MDNEKNVYFTFVSYKGPQLARVTLTTPFE